MIRQINYLRSLAVATILLAFSGAVSAQEYREARENALQYLRANYQQFGLTQNDVADLQITDAYQSKHNQLTHVWIRQQHQGIPVFNGLIGLHMASTGKIYHLGHRFVSELDRKVNATSPSMSAAQAVSMAMLHLGIKDAAPSLKSRINDRNWVFEGGNVSRKEIPVSANYAKMDDGTVRLSWMMVIDQVNTSDLWTLCVDAQTGEIVEKINHTVYCVAGHFGHGAADCPGYTEETNTVSVPTAPASLADATYNVFALPAESPSHGPRQLVTNPHDVVASPYGWHDTNGSEGAEYTYTRGNNVWSFEDRFNDNTPNAAESADGGAGLVFDFPFSELATPVENKGAAITNLFYMNNKMHDITYRYGFDEEAGNFQFNNYNKPGQGNDHVLAQALDGADLATPTLNNANFSTPPDGSSGRMQMYLWNTTGGRLVQVNAPGVIAGSYYGGQGGWGGSITNTPTTAEGVFVNDGVEPTTGCEPPTNNVAGKIVMIDRGECEFGYKAYLAQLAGASGCIICDHEAPPKTGFGAGAYGAQVTIPTVWMKKGDCALLRQYAGAGLNISLVQPVVNGPEFVDGDFDNGIIAHEYGHGISNRLTGGPSNTGCLGNAEQMGEGWSDFFSLVMSVRPGDVATTKRGVGTFVFGQPNDGNGIRRYPYSADMNINPITFSTVAENPQVHALGEVWTSMIWDLYWAMVEKYGYDPDYNNPNSGNARTIQMVMDGMKLQPCGPGFQDGRDAIRLANEIYYNGADTCLIMSVFARRGLGVNASQNSPEDGTDGLENFDPIPTCVKELKIEKIAVTPEIEAGETAQFQIRVTNHKGAAAPSVVVTDNLPNGLSFVSASNGGTAVGNTVVWNLGTMADGQVITLNYTLKSDPNLASSPYFYDPVESEDNWFSLSLDPVNVELFALQTDEAKVGDAAFFANESTTLATDFALESAQQVTISGTQPVLRFWHKFNTEPSADAGFVEFRDDNAPNPVWRRVTSDVTFRDGYTGRVAYGTFALPNHYGFSGASGDWVRSYFDMSEYAGKTISFRFRFGTDDNTGPANGGWWVDAVEFMDMFNYNTEACVTSGSEQHCAIAKARGVIVNPATVGTDEVVFSDNPLYVQPNPASEFFSVTMTDDIQGDIVFSLTSTDGRKVISRQVQGVSNGQILTFDARNLPSGMYILQMESTQKKGTAKVMIR